MRRVVAGLIRRPRHRGLLPIGTVDSGVHGVAINVGANTTLPGFRAPIHPDGSFEYVPIPEREPTDDPVPTYADLDLPFSVPAELLDRRVHHDPAFAGTHGAETYTYGDEHGVKAGPLSDLSAGDWALFYATLSTAGRGELSVRDDADPADWQAPAWGAYLIGAFRLAVDPVTGEGFRALPPDERERFAENAHLRRETVDAKVLLAGDPDESRLFDRAVPLSSRDAGSEANRLVTDLSGDSGKGPWWRRPLRFDREGVETLLSCAEHGDYDVAFA